MERQGRACVAPPQRGSRWQACCASSAAHLEEPCSALLALPPVALPRGGQSGFADVLSLHDTCVHMMTEKRKIVEWQERKHG